MSSEIVNLPNLLGQLRGLIQSARRQALRAVDTHTGAYLLGNRATRRGIRAAGRRPCSVWGSPDCYSGGIADSRIRAWVLGLMSATCVTCELSFNVSRF